MDVATNQAELYDKLLQTGWSLDSISFKNGVYIAKAKNETTGQDIERNGKSPEMALASVLRFATQAYNVRRNAGLSKFAAWDGSFLDKQEEVAQAYAKMDPFDQKAIPAWKALAAESKIQADAVKKQITVQVVDDPEPYFSVDEMCNDVHQNRHYSVSRANADHPVWSPEDVINFRVVNDVVAHCQTGAGFDWAGENKAFNTHAPLCSPMAREALFVETVGRAAYEKSFRGHGPVKIGFLSQFLHPVQEQQGEHVWVPHGGLPDQGALAAGIMDQAMGGAAGPNPQVPFTSPPFERAPAVMEGYKPKKIGKRVDWSKIKTSLFGWGSEPYNIPNNPDIEIETPEYVPGEDDPMTVPEEWPETAPAPEPERELEPALSMVRVAADEVTENGLKSAYAEEMYGWKILAVDSDGNLISPTHPATWPVGKPLEATWSDTDAIRNTAGIHLTDEKGWRELYGYIRHADTVLVKCRVWNFKGRKILYDSHAGTMRAPLAKPVLAVSPRKDLLLKVANKYGIDTEVAGTGEQQVDVVWPHQDEDDEEYNVNEDWRLVQYKGAQGEWQGFQFSPGGSNNNTYYVLDPKGVEQATVEMELTWDSYTFQEQPEDAEVQEISVNSEAAHDFLYDFFEEMSEPHWTQSKSMEDGDYNYQTADWRDYETVGDADELVDLFEKGMGHFGWDEYYYEWDDSDVQYELDTSSRDEYGLYYYTATIYEPAPPELRFDPEDWHNIFMEEVQMLEAEWGVNMSELEKLAQALVEVPKFILEENAQSDTSARKEWEGQGGMNFIRSQIDMVRPWETAQPNVETGEPSSLEHFLKTIEYYSGGGAAEVHKDQGALFTPPSTKWDQERGKSVEIPGADWQGIPGTFAKKAGRDPDYLFVYYKSELRVKKFEHNLLQSDMLEKLLDEFGVDMGNTGLDIDPAEVAAGEIFAYPDGEYRIEHKQLSNPEVRDHAEELLDDWLFDWRSIGQARDPSSGQFV